MPTKTKTKPVLTRAEWTAALRSGEHQQATGVLTRLEVDNTLSHCCLGVACHLAAARGIVVSTVVRDHFTFANTPPGAETVTYHSADGGFNHSGTLPDVLRDMLQLNELEEQALINMNDYRRATFSEIADAIDAL